MTWLERFERLVQDDADRDAVLIREAIAAAGQGPEAAERAADLTTSMIFGRTSEDVYGLCCGVTAVALSAVAALNADPKVDRPPDTGVWMLDHLRPALRDDEDEEIRPDRLKDWRSFRSARLMDPGERFAYEFTSALEEAREPGDDETVRLFNGIAVQGVAFVTYATAYLIKHVAEVTGRATELHLTAEGDAR